MLHDLSSQHTHFLFMGHFNAFHNTIHPVTKSFCTPVPPAANLTYRKSTLSVAFMLAEDGNSRARLATSGFSSWPYSNLPFYFFLKQNWEIRSADLFLNKHFKTHFPVPCLPLLNPVLVRPVDYTLQVATLVSFKNTIC
jgi:hypothetical protein